MASAHSSDKAEHDDYGDVDFFSDPRLVADPYPFYDYLRTQCPVTPVPRSGVVAVTGYEELTEVYRNNATYSSVNPSLLPGAANRDPAHFACPAELQIDRTNARHNVAFARGVHSCPGGPLARIEGRVTIEGILDRLDDIRIDAAHHGAADARRFKYAPLCVIRGLQELHLEFTTAS